MTEAVKRVIIFCPEKQWMAKSVKKKAKKKRQGTFGGSRCVNKLTEARRSSSCCDDMVDILKWSRWHVTECVLKCCKGVVRWVVGIGRCQ